MNYALHELAKESRMGAVGTEAARDVRVIDMSDFESRHAEIADQLWDAAGRRRLLPTLAPRHRTGHGARGPSR